MSVKITADTSNALAALAEVKKQIFWAIPGAINNSTRRIRDTINSDYRRFGSSVPSHMNPSRSGLGFTDRTGNLRSSISSDIDIRTNRVVGTLSAGMPYDVYVELLWGGRYSFMLPATMQNLDYITDQVEQAVIKAVNRSAR